MSADNKYWNIVAVIFYTVKLSMFRSVSSVLHSHLECQKMDLSAIYPLFEAFCFTTPSSVVQVFIHHIDLWFSFNCSCIAFGLLFKTFKRTLITIIK